VAHQLLIKIYPEHRGLVHAAVMMCVGRTNKLYGWLRRRMSIAATSRTGAANGSFGKPWYMNIVTRETGKFVPNKEPIGWVSGRSLPRSCMLCEKDAVSKFSKWCLDCRPVREKTGPIRTVKNKSSFSNEEKLEALKLFNGKIRPALFHLGLNDSGFHYKQMQKLKAAVYPLATNELKG